MAQVGGPDGVGIGTARGCQRGALLDPADAELGGGVDQRPAGEEDRRGGQVRLRQIAEVRREQVALRVLAARGADRRGRAGEVGERAGGGHWTCESRRARRPSVGSG